MNAPTRTSLPLFLLLLRSACSRSSRPAPRPDPGTRASPAAAERPAPLSRLRSATARRRRGRRGPAAAAAVTARPADPRRPRSLRPNRARHRRIDARTSPRSGTSSRPHPGPGTHPDSDPGPGQQLDLLGRLDRQPADRHRSTLGHERGLSFRGRRPEARLSRPLRLLPSPTAAATRARTTASPPRRWKTSANTARSPSSAGARSRPPPASTSRTSSSPT